MKKYQTKERLGTRFLDMARNLASFCRGLKTFAPRVEPFMRGPMIATSEEKKVTLETREGTVTLERLSPEGAATRTHIIKVRRNNSAR